ncbi:MAG: GYD domain-containing protein, partial [Dehalococcoidia bacterium]
MPIFVALGKATEAGRSRTLEALGERHTRAVARAEDAGARVLASYALLGPYDYLTLLDAPDIETVARILIREAARGNVHYEIHPALPMEQFARLVGEEEVLKPHRLVRKRAKDAGTPAE